MRDIDRATQPLQIPDMLGYELLFAALGQLESCASRRRRKELRAVGQLALEQTAAESPSPLTLSGRDAHVAREAIRAYTEARVGDTELTGSECFLVARGLDMLDEV
jgi:hypothetical protein